MSRDYFSEFETQQEKLEYPPGTQHWSFDSWLPRSMSVSMGGWSSPMP